MPVGIDQQSSAKSSQANGFIAVFIEDSEVLFQFIRIWQQRVRLSLASIAIVLGSGGILRASDPNSPSEIPSVEEFWGVQALVHSKGRLSLDGIQGAASCAASGCHGGPAVAVASASAPRGSEYPLFLENDPHSRSWQTLNSDASIAILTKLGILRQGTIVQPDAYRNCLACHNTDHAIDEAIDSGFAPAIAEGVGCESCHGPSQAWSNAHYQGPDSLRKAKSELGLVDSKPLLQRAKICALCHVGAKDRDMNHDIIAAGHPALYFDMSVYHTAYPKHWREPEAGTESFRAKLWWAGQIAKADAELELIQSRAANERTVSVWPEFSMLQCTSCHQTLDGFSPPPTFAAPDAGGIDWQQPGRASLRRWNLQGIQLLQSHFANPKDPKDANSSLEDLTRILSSLSPPRQTVAEQTTALRETMVQSLSREGLSITNQWNATMQRHQAIQDLRRAIDTTDWEQASLAYVTAWAAIQPPASGNLQDNMTTIRNGLVFPRGIQSPWFPRADSSANPPTRKEWNAAVEQLLESMQQIEP